MKKMSVLESKEVSGGAYYNGPYYYAAGLRFNCNHGCGSSGAKKAHTVTGNSKQGFNVTHHCSWAP